MVDVDGWSHRRRECGHIIWLQRWALAQQHSSTAAQRCVLAAVHHQVLHPLCPTALVQLCLHVKGISVAKQP